jgi:hypothetical protein
MFTANNLLYQYNWKHDAGDNPHKKHLDKFLLDRTEGYEMMNFIDHILSSWNWSSPLTQSSEIATGQKIERMIKTVVPHNIHHRDQIEQWLNQNWTAH